MRRGVKIVDSNAEITQGSRADRHWLQTGWKEYFRRIRPGIKLPAGFKTNDPDVVVDRFNLSGIGFGNWLSVEDKINYLSSLILAMYDLNKVLKFGYNLGFGRLGISFGARGSGRALAHYEPGSDIINITRYKNGLSPKSERFFYTGGVGSLAHEYGHFLDYFAGSTLAVHKNLYSLTNGDSVDRSRTGARSELRRAMDEILEKIIWKTPGEKFSRYYKRLLDAVGNGNKGVYYRQRNELFARAFESYTLLKLKKLGIRNHLLTSPKYTPQIYLTASEIKALEPLFDNLVTLIKNRIK